MSCDERGRRLSSSESDVQKNTPIPFLIPIGLYWVSSVSFIWFLLRFKQTYLQTANQLGSFL